MKNRGEEYTVLDRDFIFKFYNIKFLVYIRTVCLFHTFKSFGIYSMLVALSGLAMRQPLLIVLKQPCLLNKIKDLSFAQEKINV